MKTRKPLPRAKKPLARRNAARKTYLKRSTKPIRKVNPKAQAKRKIGYRKMLGSKEYLAAKAEAWERADGMCEGTTDHLFVSNNGVGIGFTPGRCWSTDRLQAHHLRYPKSRPVEATDLQILCFGHHAKAECAKMHKTRMF